MPKPPKKKKPWFRSEYSKTVPIIKRRKPRPKKK